MVNSESQREQKTDALKLITKIKLQCLPMSGSDDKIISKASASVKALSDEEFDKILPTVLKSYLKKKLVAQKIVAVDELNHNPDLVIPLFQDISDPSFASVMAAYISQNSQEKQAIINSKLQRLILLVAVGTLITGLLSVVLPYFYPR